MPISARFFLCCLFPLLLVPAPGQAQSAGLEVAGLAVRRFSGQISREMATAAALSAARLEALHRLERELPQLEEIRGLLASSAVPGQPQPEPLALALALCNGEGEERSLLEPSAGLLEARVTLRPRLERIAGLLRRMPRLDYYALALRGEAEALAAYDLAAAAASAPTEAVAAATATERLLAVRAYIDLLSELSAAEERAAEDMAGGEEIAGLVEKLSAIVERAPKEPTILTDLALALLLLHDPQAAEKNLNLALKHAPDFAPAYELRGTALLALGRPALAAEDFSRAIALRPGLPAAYENRALVWRILDETERMCLDLDKACGLGACAGLGWARERGLCPD